MLVVDASVLVTALIDGAAPGERTRERLRADPDLHAPHLLDLEVLSVLRRELRAGGLTEQQVGRALGAPLPGRTAPVSRATLR